MVHLAEHLACTRPAEYFPAAHTRPHRHRARAPPLHTRRAEQIKAEGFTVATVSWGNVEQGTMAQIASEPLSTYQIYRPTLVTAPDTAESLSVIGSTGTIIESLCPEVRMRGRPLPPCVYACVCSPCMQHARMCVCMRHYRCSTLQ